MRSRTLYSVNKMSSARDRKEPWYVGKNCHECMDCGTLIEYAWEDDDRCSCEINEEDE